MTPFDSMGLDQEPASSVFPLSYSFAMNDFTPFHCREAQDGCGTGRWGIRWSTERNAGMFSMWLWASWSISLWVMDSHTGWEDKAPRHLESFIGIPLFLSDICHRAQQKWTPRLSQRPLCAWVGVSLGSPKLSKHRGAHVCVPSWHPSGLSLD